jgi:ribonuclease P protein component
MEEKCLPAEEQGAEKNLPFQTKNVSNNFLQLINGLSLSKVERLKKKSVIDEIFLRGKTIQKSGFAFLYLKQSNSFGIPVQVMFAVSRKNIKRAHERNRVKRWMREVWRHQKAKVYRTVLSTQQQYALCIMYKSKAIPCFHTVSENIQNLCERFCIAIQEENG